VPGVCASTRSSPAPRRSSAHASRVIIHFHKELEDLVTKITKVTEILKFTMLKHEGYEDLRGFAIAMIFESLVVFVRGRAE
jgi:hypothetical protein